MVLVEEYVKRHNLQFPVVVHPQSGSSSLMMRHVGNWRSSFESPWVILNIQWVTHPQRPGQYIIRSHTPLPDSHVRRESFVSGDPQTCPYDAFEEFVLSYTKAMSGSVKAIDGNFIAIQTACWQILCHCFDSFLSRNASSRLIQNIENSLDPGLANDVRFNAQDRALDILRRDHPSIHERWETQVLPWGKNHMNWLARLVNAGE